MQQTRIHVLMCRKFLVFQHDQLFDKKAHPNIAFEKKSLVKICDYKNGKK